MRRKICFIWIMWAVILGVSACGQSGRPAESSGEESAAQSEGGEEPAAQSEGTGEQSAASGERTDAEESAESSEDSNICTFTDDLGREVSVGAPERVAALLGSYADMWVLAGGRVCAAPDDAFVDFELPLSEETVNLGGTKSLSLELLLASEPDFVLASTNTPQHLEWQQSLEDAGISVAYFDVACFEDYLRVLKICTDITGEEERYEKYGTDIQTKINEILEKYAGREPGTVLYMRASATSIRAKGNEGNVLGEMLESFGWVNIADIEESLLENLSIESILLQNPDRILLVQSGDDIEGIKENIETMFGENPLWNEMDAVKNGQVHILDKHLYNLKPNARWAEAYEELGVILYGE